MGDEVSFARKRVIIDETVKSMEEVIVLQGKQGDPDFQATDLVLLTLHTCARALQALRYVPSPEEDRGWQDRQTMVVAKGIEVFLYGLPEDIDEWRRTSVFAVSVCLGASSDLVTHRLMGKRDVEVERRRRKLAIEADPWATTDEYEEVPMSAETEATARMTKLTEQLWKRTRLVAHPLSVKDVQGYLHVISLLGRVDILRQIMDYLERWAGEYENTAIDIHREAFVRRGIARCYLAAAESNSHSPSELHSVVLENLEAFESRWSDLVLNEALNQAEEESLGHLQKHAAAVRGHTISCLAALGDHEGAVILINQHLSCLTPQTRPLIRKLSETCLPSLLRYCGINTYRSLIRSLMDRKGLLAKQAGRASISRTSTTSLLSLYAQPSGIDSPLDLVETMTAYLVNHERLWLGFYTHIIDPLLVETLSSTSIDPSRNRTLLLKAYEVHVTVSQMIEKNRVFDSHRQVNVTPFETTSRLVGCLRLFGLVVEAQSAALAWSARALGPIVKDEATSKKVEEMIERGFGRLIMMEGPVEEERKRRLIVAQVVDAFLLRHGAGLLAVRWLREQYVRADRGEESYAAIVEREKREGWEVRLKTIRELLDESKYEEEEERDERGRPILKSRAARARLVPP